MITINYYSNNPSTLYELQHFFLKYGIAVRYNKEPGINESGINESGINESGINESGINEPGISKPCIDIVYCTDSREKKFLIQVRDNESRQESTGSLEIEDKKVPLFKIPCNLENEGEAVIFYVDSNVKYPCVTLLDNRITIGFDIFKETGYALFGSHEEALKNTGNGKKDAVRVPFADCYEKILFDSLILAAKRLNVPLVHKAFWPDGKRFAVCLTHDVDEIKKKYQWVTSPFRFAIKRDLTGIYNQSCSLMHKIKGEEPYWTFKKIMELEESLRVKSSFFFLNETGKVKLLDKKTWRHFGRRYSFDDPKVANVIRELHSKGWDVGLHGSFYSHNDLKKLRKEKKALETSLGGKIHGIRQHNLNLSIPDTWLYQEGTGLEYDTTLGFNHCIGFRWGTCFPFRPFYAEENRVLEILEIPLVIEDLPFFRYESPWEEGLKVIREVEKFGGVVTLLWHHSVFNEHEFPGWGASYERIIEHCKRKNAWVTSAREISDWWIWREKTSFEWDYEGNTLRIIPYPRENNHFLNIYPPQNMFLKKISNAEIVGIDDIVPNENMFSIRTNILNNDECVKIEFTEWDNGSHVEASR